MTYQNIVLILYFSISLISLQLPLNPLFVIHPLTYLSMLIFIILGIVDNEFKNTHTFVRNLIITYWLYSIFVIFKGVGTAESYWDYKNIFVTYIPSVIVSFCIFIGLAFEKNLSLLRFIIKKLFPISLFVGMIFIIFFNKTFFDNDYNHVVVRLTIPVFFFVLALPYLKRHHQILIILMSIFCLTVDLGWRANIYRMGVCFSFVIFYIIFSFRVGRLNFIGTIIFVIPLIFLYLGSIGKYDVFTSLEGSTDVEEQSSFSGNTRTFLYKEVLDSINNKNTSLLIGTGASGTYSTIFFSDAKASSYVIQTRYATEVSFLNTLNHSGIIGVMFDTLLIFITGYLAINRSNNNFSKLLGLYLFSTWILYFIEMPQSLNLNYFIHYFIIGLCLNNSFRESSNEKIKSFFKSL